MQGGVSRQNVRLAVALTVMASGATLQAADLTARALAGWSSYVAATERRRAAEHPGPTRFLAADFTTAGAADRRRLARGETVVRRVEWAGRDGVDVDVPDALVHHWRGAVLVRGLSLDALLARLQAEPPPQADVLKASVLERNGGLMKVFLRLRRTKIVTVFYDTEHDVRFTRLDAHHAASTSVATKIVQLEAEGTPRERTLPAGEDSGYLWRLNAYWRYEEVPDGVIAECESLTLSRRVPFGLQTIAAPIISSTARESMEAALGAVAALGRKQ